MGEARQHNAPLTLELIVRVNERLASLGMSREGFRVELNKYLPAHKQIAGDHSGIVKLNRWMNPTGCRWPEPRAEIALAMQKFLENNH